MPKYKIVNDKDMDSKKEDYCPRCCFEDEKTVLRKDCKKHVRRTITV